ncbi:MAG TPA: dolichol-phosphate mannosyltransferase, partial [Planctomycetota bacterium]|nr:dolichol-phosphate mannosyltransferase [Planctomycetota bacterium]
MPLTNQPSRLRAGLVLLMLTAVLLFSGLGAYPLLDRDESRYGQIPREMLERGDWLRPTLYGEIYEDKPPLQYWQVMLSFRLFGRNEFA